MNIETTAGNLKLALAALNGIVERRNTSPVLGTVKFHDGRITATNLDMEATVAMPSTGKPMGEAAIDYFPLSALAKHIPADETVSIGEDDHLATVKFNGSEYGVPSLPASDFPVFGDVTGERTVSDNIGLVAAMRRVRFAVSTEETRYYLNGVSLVEKDGKAHAVATNGYMLALMPLPVMPAGATGAIIRTDTVSYLCARKVEPKAVTFQGDRPRALFEYDGLSLSAKLVDGTYPDISRVIPGDTVPHLTCDRVRLLTILRRLEAFGLDGYHCVKVTAGNGSLTLSSVKAERSALERMDGVECLTFEAGYTARYLIDILTALTGETVTFAAEAGQINGSPCIVTSEGDTLKTVIMPMRI